jgi:flagellar assembly protein FliH
VQFIESSWQILGEFHDEGGFEEHQFPRISAERTADSPLFKDFGGETTEAGRRFESGDSARRGLEKEVEAELARRMHQQEQEFAQRLEQARAEGHAAGVAEAQAQAEVKLEELQGTIGGILQDIQTQLNENIQTVEQQAVELAVMIAQKVIGAVVEHNPESILEVVKGAISASGAATIEAIRVSERDYAFLHAGNAVSDLVGGGAGWSFVADAKIRSGCVVEMRGSQVDYQLDLAWERVRAQVLKCTKQVGR